MRLKLEGCQSELEIQVGDLERDVQDLTGQVDRLSQALCDAERDKSRLQGEHAEHIQQLREQLSTAMEVEQTLTSELQTLKQELRQHGHNNRAQDEELLSAMREQVVRLSQKDQALEERLRSVCEDNNDLRDSLASLHTRLNLQEHQNQQQSQQLAEAWQETAAARGRSQQLQVQLEELQEELSLQKESGFGNLSLLSELESSLDSLGPDREQITQEVHYLLKLLQPLTQEVKHLEGSRVMGQMEEDLQTMLIQLKSVAENLANGTHRHQISQLQEENAELKLKLEDRPDTDVVKQAIRDRDEAIAKKNLMEAELMRSKNDMMCLNNQLLEAIQRKLELSQELEAWQDDIQVIINQQLRTQQQSEQVQQAHRKPTSFWGRPSTVSSTTARLPSSSSTSWTSEALQDKPQSPWRDWLRRGNVAQSSK